MSGEKTALPLHSRDVIVFGLILTCGGDAIRPFEQFPKSNQMNNSSAPAFPIAIPSRRIIPMTASSFSSHHNGDPYWARVLEAVDELRGPLRNIARGKKWEFAADRFDLIGTAQAIVITEDAWRPVDETEEQKAVRLSARDFERALLAARAAVMRKNRWRIDPEENPLLMPMNDDLAVVRRYAWPQTMLPAVFIARRIIWSLRHANRLRPPNAPELPTGLGSTGVIVGLTCEALDRINRKKNPGAKTVDPVAIRKELTKHRSVLGV